MMIMVKNSTNRKFNNKCKKVFLTSTVLTSYTIFVFYVGSQNGYYGHFNDMNCNVIVIWWYEKCVVVT